MMGKYIIEKLKNEFIFWKKINYSFCQCETGPRLWSKAGSMNVWLLHTHNWSNGNAKFNIASTLVWILMQEESSPQKTTMLVLDWGHFPWGTNLPTVVSRTPPMHRTQSKKFPGLSGGYLFYPWISSLWCIHTWC